MPRPIRPVTVTIDAASITAALKAGRVNASADGAPAVQATGSFMERWFGQTGSAAAFLTGQNGTLVPVAAPTNAMATGAGLSVNAQVKRYGGGAWDFNKKPSSVKRLPSSAAGTNAAAIIGARADLFGALGRNTAAAVLYLKLFDKNGAPVVGTDTPLLNLPLSPQSPFNYPFDSLVFQNGMSFALTAGPADLDATPVAAGDVVGLNILYQ